MVRIRQRLRTRGWLAPMIGGLGYSLGTLGYETDRCLGNIDFVSAERPWRWLDYIFNPLAGLALLAIAFIWLARTLVRHRAWTNIVPIPTPVRLVVNAAMPTGRSAPVDNAPAAEWLGNKRVRRSLRTFVSRASCNGKTLRDRPIARLTIT